MDVSSVSPEAAVMAAMQGANAVKYSTAVMGAAQRVRKEEGAALVSLIQQAMPNPNVGQNLNVYA